MLHLDRFISTKTGIKNVIGVYVLEIFVGDQRSSVSNYCFKIRHLYHETL